MNQETALSISAGHRKRYAGAKAGVFPLGDKWGARINVKRHQIHLGLYGVKSHAIKARKWAEKHIATLDLDFPNLSKTQIKTLRLSAAIHACPYLAG